MTDSDKTVQIVEVRVNSRVIVFLGGSILGLTLSIIFIIVYSFIFY